MQNMWHLGDAKLDWNVRDDRLIFTPHHNAHTLSSFARSGMTDALVVVLDGRGEDRSGTIYRGGPGGLTSLASLPLYKSLGTFYEASIHLVGYRFGDEYKVMGLATSSRCCTCSNPTGTTRSTRMRLRTCSSQADFRHWAMSTGLPKLRFTGGVARNSTLNGQILRSGLFDEAFVRPASHDAGAAEGAALAATQKLGGTPFGRPRVR